MVQRPEAIGYSCRRWNKRRHRNLRGRQRGVMRAAARHEAQGNADLKARWHLLFGRSTTSPKDLP